MFEKEAEEYAKQNNPAEYGVRATHFTVLNSFKDGATFGYNKAKEEMQEQGLALQSDMDKTIEQNIALKELVEKYRQAVDKCLHITFMGGGCEVNTIGQYATLVDGYLTDVEGLAKWKN